MKITYYGHSCLEVELAGKRVLFDPFITPNEKAASVDIDSIKPDTIFLTHGHEDHVADAVHIAKSSGATVVANFEVATWMVKQGINNCIPVNQGGTISLPFGKAKAVNAIHSSSLPDGSYGGNPLGFILFSEAGDFYHSGDTALTYDMKLISEWSNLRAAALCIGDHFTMGTEDAATAAEWIGCKEIVGIHYDTFPPIEIDPEAAKSTFLNKNVTLHLPAIGETLSI